MVKIITEGDMLTLGIEKPSTRSLGRMLKGLPVRLKGGALPLKVHSGRHHKMMKAFHGGKGHQLAMSPEEISANGAGIFGKKFDRFLEKKGVKKLAYKVGDIAKPFVKRGVDALTAEAILLQPELAPVAFGANYLAKDYLDNPSRYQGSGMKKRGRPRGTGTKILDQKFSANDAIKFFKNDLPRAITGKGTKILDQKLSANDAIRFFKNDLPKAITGKGTKILDQKVSGREAINFFRKDLPDAVAGRGLYAGGSGLYVSSGRSTGSGMRPSVKQNSLLGREIPQLVSNPQFDNFMWSATLLPPYANIHR